MVLIHWCLGVAGAIEPASFPDVAMAIERALGSNVVGLPPTIPAGSGSLRQNLTK